MSAKAKKKQKKMWFLQFCIAGVVADNIYCHFIASLISAVTTAVATLPVDMAKTRSVDPSLPPPPPPARRARSSLARRRFSEFCSGKDLFSYVSRSFRV